MATPKEKYPDLFFPEDPKTDRNVAQRRLYTATLHLLKTRFAFDPGDKLLEHLTNGSLRPQRVKLKLAPEDFPGTDPAFKKDKVYFLAVYGRLLATMADPANGKLHGGVDVGDNETILLDEDFPTEQKQTRIVPTFVRSFTSAVERWHSYDELYERVFTVLKARGQTVKDVDSAPATGFVTHIFALQLAQVVDRLVEQRVSFDTPQLAVIIDQAVEQVVGGSITGRASSIRIDLPDLELEDSVDLLPDNIRALAVLYFGAQLEDMRFFAVADKVAEHFQNGMLPVTRSLGGDYLYEYLRGAHLRFTEIERRGLYARAFGFAQGGVDEALPNREFADLWIRALSATSAFARSQATSIPTLPGSPTFVVPASNRTITHMQVHKALRDLGTNLSLHGYGVAHFAAIELQQTIKQVKTMLTNAEVCAAYGVRDMFQLVERVAQLYMNSTVNSVRQRVTAQSGSRIVEWIADNSSKLADPTPPAPVLFVDPQLVDNVEKWLAVTGTPDATVEQFSEPVAVSSQPTIPSLGLSAVTRTLRSALDAVADIGVPEA